LSSHEGRKPLAGAYHLIPSDTIWAASNLSRRIGTRPKALGKSEIGLASAEPKKFSKLSNYQAESD
jgi:hypothetical protein